MGTYFFRFHNLGRHQELFTFCQISLKTPLRWSKSRPKVSWKVHFNFCRYFTLKSTNSQRNPDKKICNWIRCRFYDIVPHGNAYKKYLQHVLAQYIKTSWTAIRTIKWLSIKAIRKTEKHQNIFLEIDTFSFFFQLGQRLYMYSRLLPLFHTYSTMSCVSWMEFASKRLMQMTP